MPTFFHVLITLFNVRYSLKSDLHGLEKWTEERIPLFEKYCLPSLQAQTNQQFAWLIVLDPSTTKKQRKQLQEFQLKQPNIFFLDYPDWDTVEQPINEWIQSIGIDADYLITSRVDNDDILHEDFIATVQSECKRNPGEYLLNFMNGYNMRIKKKKNLLFNYQSHTNPFMSLVEENNPKLNTIRRFNHNDWPQKFTRVNVTTPEPLWLQLVHGKNLLNTVLGKPELAPTTLEQFQLNSEQSSHRNAWRHYWEKILVFYSKPFKRLDETINPEPY